MNDVSPTHEWPSVAVLVLNWNHWEDTICCVKSLQASDYPQFEIFVIDNGSTNDSVARIERRLGIDVLQTHSNLGFAGGMNHGIEKALEKPHQLLWLLNNDTQVAPDSLRCLVEKLLESPSTGAASSVLMEMHDPERVAVWGGGTIRWRTCRTEPLFKPGEPDYLVGASLLIRSSVIADVGLLDEQFFMYWEDVDYSLRMREKGWDIAVANKSRVWHDESSSSGKASPRLDELYTRATIRFCRKWYRWPMLHYGPLLTIRWSKRIATGQIERAKTLWRAARDA